MSNIIYRYVLQILFVCFLSHSLSSPITKQEITEHRNRELEKYLMKLETIMSHVEENHIDKDTLPHLSTENATESMIKMHEWIESHPDVHTKFNEIKIHEIRMLRELYKQSINPDPNISEEIRKSIIQKIANKEQYLAGASAGSFELRDSMRVLGIVNQHIATEDSARQSVLRLKHLRHRIEQLSEMTKTSRLTHQDYVELMKQADNKTKSFTHIPYPLSHEQLLHTWMHSDNLSEDTFDEKHFFELHDYNDDGAIDPEELEALMSPMLASLSEDERDNELIRMRNFTRHAIDKNKDGMITLEELREYTNNSKATDNTDKNWETENLDKLHGTKGSAQEDYKEALKELNDEKPDSGDTELTTEWEMARRKLEEAYAEIMGSDAEGAGGSH